MQKSMTTGRSSYVEMRAASRMFAHNLGLKINSIKSLTSGGKYSELATIFPTLSSGYEFTLTPNGILKRNNLEELLSIDSDIALLLTSIEDALKINGQAHLKHQLDALKEFLGKRKTLIEILKA